MIWPTRLYVAIRRAVSRRSAAPQPKPELPTRHEVTDSYAVNGCAGVGECLHCTLVLQAFTSKLEWGCAYPLPKHDLIVWPDGTYSLMPAMRPDLN